MSKKDNLRNTELGTLLLLGSACNEAVSYVRTNFDKDIDWLLANADDDDWREWLAERVDINSKDVLGQWIDYVLGQTRLDLSRHWLPELPSEIGQLTKLEVLYLSRNRLTELPSEIGQLANLEVLFLSRNQLTELPAEIGQLTNLTGLDLSANQLTELSPEIRAMKHRGVRVYT